MKMAGWREKAACPDRQEGVPRVWPFSGSTPSLPTGPSPHLGLAGRGSAGGPWGALGMNCRIPSPQQFLNANHRSTAPACTACPFRTVRGLMARCGPSTWLKRRQLRRGWVPACLAPLPGGGGLSGPPRPMQLPHPPAPSASPPTAQLTGFLDHHIHPSWQVRSTSFLFECPLIRLSDPSPLSPAV